MLLFSSLTKDRSCGCTNHELQWNNLSESSSCVLCTLHVGRKLKLGAIRVNLQSADYFMSYCRHCRVCVLLGDVGKVLYLHKRPVGVPQKYILLIAARTTLKCQLNNSKSLNCNCTVGKHILLSCSG